MSFSWLFLGGILSSRARLRFTNRGQCAVNSIRRSRIFHRTAKYLLTVCLTPGGKRKARRDLFLAVRVILTIVAILWPRLSHSAGLFVYIVYKICNLCVIKASPKFNSVRGHHFHNLQIITFPWVHYGSKTQWDRTSFNWTACVANCCIAAVRRSTISLVRSIARRADSGTNCA
jgi:hypothetical protein